MQKINDNGLDGIRQKSIPKKPIKLRKMFHCALITFISCLIVMTTFTLPAYAKTVTITEETDFNDTQHAYSVQGDSHWNDGGTRASFYTGGWSALKADGEYSFCLEPWKKVDHGTVVTEGDLNTMIGLSSSKQLSQIGYFGYWDTEKTRADYITTQLMIWEARGWTVVTAPAYYADKKAVIQSKIAQSAKQLSFTGTTQTVKVNETVSFTDTNGVLSDYMKAAGYPNQNTNYTKDGVTLKWNGNTLYLTPTINANDTFRLNITNVSNGFIGTPIVYYNGNVQLTSPLRYLDDPAYSSLRLNIEKNGRARIVKYDAVTGKIVQRPGIVYDVYRASDETYVTTATSDATGVALTGLIPLDDYYYIERIAPDKYLVNKERHYFTIDKSESDLPYLDLSINDKPVTVKSTIYKEDKETGTTAQGDATLDGAVYGFYAAEDIYDHSNDGTIIYHKDDLVGTHTIKDGSATATSDYPGIYYWFEKQPSEGYLLDPDKHYVNLNYADQDTAVVVKDTVSLEQVKKQPIAFVKLETPGNGIAPPLGGAELTLIPKKYVELYGSFEAAHEIAKLNDGRILPTEWTSVVTADDGSAMTKPMPYCRYITSETAVPKDHYPVDDFEIIVSEQSDTPVKIHYLVDEILETALKIVKTDAETGNTVPIAGMRFKVKCLTQTADFKAGEYFGWQAKYPNWEYIDEFVTNENGDVTLEKLLKAGTYQIEEIESGNPYLLNHEPMIFTITEGWHQTVGPDGETLITTVEFPNHQVKGQVRINKIADIFKGYTSEMTEYGELFTPVYEPGMLAGVKFKVKAVTDIVGVDGTIHYRAGEEIELLTTDGENITESMLMPLGSNNFNLYSLSEFETQDGYVLDDTIYYFRFDYVDENTPVVAPTWLDENGNELDFDGELELKNKKQTAIAVANKVMEQSDGSNDVSNAHRNVTFGLFSETVKGLQPNSLVGIGKLDEDHRIEVPFSQEGELYLKEISTDPLYQLDPTRYPVKFVYNGDEIQTITVNGGVIENKLKRATIEIIKYTEDDLYYSSLEQAKLAELGVDMSEYMRNDRLGDGRNYLAFHEFELATDRAFTNIVRTGMTDVNGRLVFEDLELSTYYAREKGSSDFYEINDEVFKIILSEHGQFETVEVKNDLMTSHVDIKKVDYYDQTKTLPFAGFTMYANPECTQPLQEMYTGLDGIARFEVKFGQTVYFKESSAPMGYGLSSEIVKVTIDENWVNGTKVITYLDLPEETPNTGSSVSTIPFIGLSLTGFAIMVLALKKRKSENE